jgi:uncharacterized OB-fold protein
MTDVAAAPELTLPDRLASVDEPVKSIRTPAALHFTYSPGEAPSEFLHQVTHKQLTGRRCPSCTKVYIPPRTTCPTCGVPMDERVDLPSVGTVTSFCVVNVQFYGQAMECPYVSALILIDGSDIPLMHLLQEVNVDDVHMGIRVEAVWVDDDDMGPTLESIRYFKPTGEPDAEWDTYKDNV